MMKKWASILLLGLLFSSPARARISRAEPLDTHRRISVPYPDNAFINRLEFSNGPRATLFDHAFNRMDLWMQRAAAAIYGNGQTPHLKSSFLIALNRDWHLVGRQSLFVVHNADVIDGYGAFEENLGLGDATFMALVSPAQPGGAFTWGAGPAITLPTATEDGYGEGNWQLGPAAMGFHHGNNWILGLSSQHFWSFAADGNGVSASRTILQYFFEYNPSDRLEIGLSHHVMFNWNNERKYAWPYSLDLNEARTFGVGRLPFKVSIDGFFEVSANWKF